MILYSYTENDCIESIMTLTRKDNLMSVVVYLKNSGVATSAEIISYAKSDPAGFATLKLWAREQARNEGIELEADKQ